MSRPARYNRSPTNSGFTQVRPISRHPGIFHTACVEEKKESASFCELDKTVGFLQAFSHMKTTTLQLNHMSCPLVLLLIPLALACFALPPQARATCQEGCFTIENTVLGDNALMNNAGSFNTAIG